PGEIWIPRRDHPICQECPPVSRSIQRQRRSVEGSRRQRTTKFRVVYFSLLHCKHQGAAFRLVRFHVGARKEIGHAEVGGLSPFLEGMVVALCALNANSQECL